MPTTYTKLRDGSWGLRISGSAQAGQTISVTKKSGESKTETVGKVLWTGNGITLAAIGQSERGGHSNGGRRACGEVHRGRCCGGNCSSMGTGRACGAECCDGY